MVIAATLSEVVDDTLHPVGQHPRQIQRKHDVGVVVNAASIDQPYPHLYLSVLVGQVVRRADEILRPGHLKQ
jgi:hypothetical protein